MKLSDTEPRTPGPVGEEAQTDPSFTEMTELERDAALLMMIADLAEITENLEDRLQTLELQGVV